MLFRGSVTETRLWLKASFSCYFQVNSKPESCVWPGSRQGRWDSSAPSRAPGAGSLGGARCTHTACVWRPEDVSASDRAYADFSLHKVKCQEKKASDEEKSMTWSREHREGTEDMTKPRNSSKLNTETLVLSWTVERCALLDP